MKIKEAVETLYSYGVEYEDINEATDTLLTAYEKEKEENKRLRKCHLLYEEMTGIDLLLPDKEE